MKQMIVHKKEENGQSLMAAMLAEEAVDKPPVRVPNKHIIPADSILVNKELGTGEFGVVQQGVWTNDGERVSFRFGDIGRVAKFAKKVSNSSHNLRLWFRAEFS